MGKNKRNKNKAKNVKSSGSENVGSSSHSTSALAPEVVQQSGSAANMSSARQRVVSVGSKDKTTEPSPTLSRDEAPAIFVQDTMTGGYPTDVSKVKRDSVISSTSTGRRDSVEVAAKPVARRRRRWGAGLWRWLRQSWPFRLFRWMYHFAVALTRINWNDQRRFVDLLLVLGLVALFSFGVFIVLEFLFSQLRHAAAQPLGGSCGVAYTTACLVSDSVGSVTGPQRPYPPYSLLISASAAGSESHSMGVSTCVLPGLSSAMGNSVLTSSCTGTSAGIFSATTAAPSPSSIIPSAHAAPLGLRRLPSPDARLVQRCIWSSFRQPVQYLGVPVEYSAGARDGRAGSEGHVGVRMRHWAYC